MEFSAESLRGGEYIETVRALHQTVVSLRTALERSRSEILQLKTKAWPLENLESAVTALSLENHLLRKKILDLDKPKESDGLAGRFRSVTTSLENLTTKSQRKSSQFSGPPSRTKSFHSLHGAGDQESIFASTPLHSSRLSPRIGVSRSHLDLSKIPIFTRESDDEILDNNTNKEAKRETIIRDISADKDVTKDIQYKQPEKDKQLPTIKKSEEFEAFDAEILDRKTQSEEFDKNKQLETFDKQKLENVQLQTFDGKKNLHSFEENEQLEIFTGLESLQENKSLDEIQLQSLETVESKQLHTFEDKKKVITFEEEKQAGNNLGDAEKNAKYKPPLSPRGNLAEDKNPQLESAGTKRVTINENKSQSPDLTNKQTDLQSRDNRDKKISVSVNLEIYRRSRVKMEPEKNILQHSSSTDLLDQEVDDIELIFTNEDTKETNLKEPLISIEGNNQGQPADFDQNVSADVSDRELDDDVFNDNFENENQENINFQSQTFDFTRENSQIYNSKSDNSINQDEVKSLKSYYSYQDSSFENKSLEKDESFDRFEERARVVETDMSKVGIQDVEYSMGRRNTCPNPIQYRPIAHREAIGRGFNTRKTRPILAHSNAMRKESGAQTDISALPNKTSWRSESSLAHKVKIGDNFTTLPSKYPLPGSRLRLSEKTVESRRILLSDIGFTSMVPELSRSADHLCPTNLRTTSVTNYGQFLKTTDLYSPGYTSQKFMWMAASPSESHSQSRYSSLYPLASPPAPSRRCSAPVSPCRRNVIKHMPSKVRFANGSLPELRGDWNSTIDSGDSTDSLVEEAEQYLRRSIDCIVGGKDVIPHGTTKTSLRRASAPEPARDNIPPQGWQPFLPRLPRDLRLDYWVKVISPEGRVRGGRVRFIGDLVSHTEQFVGVQLSTPDGHSDGTHNNRRYFQCEPYHGIFVPFKKVIMGWKP